ncbi:hypothetical protein HD806DRAFT_544124 [Xylariaceae sp. AK1471]|nr:hypothetical protein HD806DRAFT_544124 [Xylariaceae sp. AK1471]
MEQHSDLLEPLIDQVNVPPTVWNELTDLDVINGLCDNGPLCALCGLEIWPACSNKWDSDIVVVGDPAREYEYVQTHGTYPPSESDYSPAVYSARMEVNGDCTRNKGCRFTLQGTTEAFVYAASQDRYNGGPNGNNTVYLPMHKSCLRIALKAPIWNLMKPPNTPLRALFRVLRHRFQVSWDQVLARFEPSTEEDFAFWSKYKARPIIFSGFQNTIGIEKSYCHKSAFVRTHQGGMADDTSLYRRYLENDPFRIPRLTETLLKNLEPREPRLTKPTQQVSVFKKLFAKLPNELKLLILEHIIDARNWPVWSTGFLGPRF